MSDYEGTIVPRNDIEKVRKLSQKVRALEGTIQGLHNTINELNAEYLVIIDGYKARLKRYELEGVKLPKGRPRFIPKASHKRQKASAANE